MCSLPCAGAGRPQGERGGKGGGAARGAGVSSKWGGGGAQGSSSRGGDDGKEEDVYDLRCVLYHKGSNVHSGHIVAEVRLSFRAMVTASGGCGGLFILYFIHSLYYLNTHFSCFILFFVALVVLGKGLY